MAMQGVFGFLASLPKILGYFEQGIGAVVSMANAMHRAAEAREHANAIEYAKITKDTSKLENIFNPKP